MTRGARSERWWLPYAGLLMMAAGVIYQAGVQSSQIQRNTERIVVLETQSSARAEADLKRDTRGARIEAKLDLLLPSGGMARRRDEEEQR